MIAVRPRVAMCNCFYFLYFGGGDRTTVLKRRGGCLGACTRWVVPNTVVGLVRGGRDGWLGAAGWGWVVGDG